MHTLHRLLAMAAGTLLAAVAHAQVPPSAAEQAAYTGVMAAAWRGDAAGLTSVDAAALRQRDGHGRTALHLATHARQHAAIGALAQAGADLGALDADRDDPVTIAAVADDEPTLALLLQLGASARGVTSRCDGTARIAADAPLDHVNNLHWTALIEAMVLGDGGARHQRTLQAGASTRLADREGRTPLQLAQARGDTAMAAALQAAGAR